MAAFAQRCSAGVAGFRSTRRRSLRPDLASLSLALRRRRVATANTDAERRRLRDDCERPVLGESQCVPRTADVFLHAINMSYVDAAVGAARVLDKRCGAILLTLGFAIAHSGSKLAGTPPYPRMPGLVDPRPRMRAALLHSDCNCRKSIVSFLRCVKVWNFNGFHLVVCGLFS